MLICRERNQAISLLLVLVFCTTLMAGCSNSKTVSADVNQKLELAVKYEEALAKTWAFKYLLKSGLGYKGALDTLSLIGITIEVDTAKRKYSKQEIMKTIVYTPEAVEKIKKRKGGKFSHPGCYLDVKKNIAYVDFVFTEIAAKEEEEWAGWKVTSSDQIWKNIIFRVHNPNIIPVTSISDLHPKTIEFANNIGASQAVAIPLKHYTDEYIIAIEGNDFEKDLVEAGISMDSVIFVDI